jgi:hypothetical protein
MKLKLFVILICLLSLSICSLRKKARDGTCPAIKYDPKGVNINLNLECQYLSGTRQFFRKY